MCKKCEIAMEIICNHNELNNAIQFVSKAVSSRPTHPILANILLTADQGTNKISLTGFDLNLEFNLLTELLKIKHIIPSKLLRNSK